ncbi:MAG TPA: toll/interleukin-1 receptor domain-containing protein [Brevundimonas sp.]|jgi:hypothetical protein
MKAFLSYPSEHVEIAREVKSFIRSTGVVCWFDKDDLVAGEDWDRARSLALREADVVVVLCAAQTTERNGVYQREINEALSLRNDRRLGLVYIIPLRIEDASLPPELSRLQYVDYFDPSWRRKCAASLARAVSEQNENVPPALQVAAAQPDEGGVVLREINEEIPQGTLSATWLSYALDGDYWDFVNGVIRARALGGLYQARRHLTEWWKPSGSDWELHISEHYRKGQLVSLTVGTSSYFSGAAHPNHGIQSINILGEAAGVVGAADLFDTSLDALKFLTDYVNLDLRRQYGRSGEEIDLTYYVETYGWEFFDQFNFNEAGMQLNFSSMSGLPHVLGYQEVYLPWQHAGHFLSPTAKRILLGSD